jgi:hypothetical protein
MNVLDRAWSYCMDVLDKAWSYCMDVLDKAWSYCMDVLDKACLYCIDVQAGLAIYTDAITNNFQFKQSISWYKCVYNQTYIERLQELY